MKPIHKEYDHIDQTKTVTYNQEGISKVTFTYGDEGTWEDVFENLVMSYLRRNKIID